MGKLWTSWNKGKKKSSPTLKGKKITEEPREKTEPGYLGIPRVGLGSSRLWETAPPARLYRMLGQTHVNEWIRVAFQNEGSTSYIFPLRLGVLQWSHHLFNYWENKKTIIEKEFLILLIWIWIYIDNRKITWLWS